MTTTTNITEALTAITGPEHIRPGDPIEVSPANTQQISEILRYANQNSLTVTPTGGKTKQSWGNPTKTNIHLSLSRLNQVIEHPWQDLTCTVQAGCTWSTLQETLKKHGQFVALDPLWPDRATVGGILATNDSGALRHRYGSLRDLVIGMTIVLADGTIARTGGKVVKNVAGYDLCKLLTGSLGTLAVITEATFRLHPLPQHAQTFTVSAPQAAQLAPLMADIRASHLLTQALQLRGDASGFHLDIQLNAHPEAKQSEILQAMTEAAGLKLEVAHDDLRQVRESLFATKNAFVAKIGMLPTDLPQIVEDIVRLDGTVVAQSLGILYAAFPNLKRDYSPLGSLYAYTDAGSMTLLQIPSNPQDDPTPPWGPDKPDPLMQAVKHQFDPNRTLNPGRLLGGI
jgi:glycolate oxidase FAD binding subunit